MFQYIVQTIAFQLFFLLVYDVFLKKETFFNWNRIYLLGTALLSLVIPLIKIESFKNVVSQDYIIRLPEVFIGNASNETGLVELNPVIVSNASSWSIWEMIFFLGAFTALFLLVFKLIKLFRLFVKNPKQKAGNLNIVNVLNSSVAFSFFRYIFLGDQIPKKDKGVILKHEIIHVDHYHSIDLLFFEVLRILFWFNPLIYMYQNRIEALHEFIADARAIESENKQAYYQNLLSQVFETKEISFINPFFKQSLIKKRIVMLTRTKSKQINLLKYVLLIPIVTGMLIYTATEAQNGKIRSTEENQELTDKQLKEKFRKELLEMEKGGFTIFEISEAFRPKGDSYVISRKSYYRDHVYKEYMLSLGEKPVKDLTKELNTTYKDYLKYKKTEEAKMLWESDIKNGFLRLVVNDLDNLTEKERQRKSKKINLIKKDDYFHALRIENVDGSKMHIQSHSSIFSTNKRDDSKAVLINNPDIHVGFDIVDKVPTFPGCEGLSHIELKKCFTESISNHIVNNFNKGIVDKLGLIGKQRIHTIFKIDESGNTIDVSVKSQYADLKAEAIRVMNTLPKMIPGKHKDKSVVVTYSLPVIFDVDFDSEKQESKLTLMK